MLLSDRGYAVKERGIINVKGKGNMRTYFILGRKISRRYGRGSGTTNNGLAEVVYGMVRARRRRTFKREKDCDSEHVAQAQETGTVITTDMPTKLGRSNPIRRSLRRLNTFRGGRSPLTDNPKPMCKTESDSKVTLDRLSQDLDSKDQIC